MATATTNYSLPQWANNENFHVIGQLNPAFNTIDAQMKRNADAAASADSAAEAAMQTASDAETAANAAKTAAATAQSTADSATTAAKASVQYGKVKLIEDAEGNGVVVTLGKVS